MQSRLGVASFIIGIAVGFGYVVIRVLSGSAPDGYTALMETLWFLIGATVVGIVGLVLGIVGWVRAVRTGQKNGLAIIGSALCAAVTVWAITTWILAFVTPLQQPA